MVDSIDAAAFREVCVAWLLFGAECCNFHLRAGYRLQERWGSSLSSELPRILLFLCRPQAMGEEGHKSEEEGKET